MKSKTSSLALTMVLTGGLLLAACDNPADSAASSAAPQAGDELPAATSSGTPTGGSVTADSSIAEDSPAGPAVTEQELPPQTDMPPPPSREVFKTPDCSFDGWVGQKVDEAAIKETGRPSRILPPGSMMTMDHSPDRINVEHDEEMTVTRVWCG